ncbi:shwachman-Bodian-diamond syndrome protein [Neohortaea acidophila]|uniref:Shwachman-Bodian-diamond syndrome protein n=1 Tax=Neohortaea acidophila TaxID=245834 RepID=A0A6A6PTK9_9PEZI|nr:shwachman-Bodian-diamond syndrome protein [Neohortaea acidophila]KAF2483225.1 shwachman-Bodian-diamond syndrome protein [Neohortaea acidophila]
MVRGNATQIKVHHQGKDEDFIIFVDSKEAVQNWKKDRSIPLAQVVSGFKILTSHKQGNQGILDTASKAALEDEFGTHRDDDVITKILETGTIVESESGGRDGSKNDSKGGLVSH